MTAFTLVAQTSRPGASEAVPGAGAGRAPRGESAAPAGAPRIADWQRRVECLEARAAELDACASMIVHELRAPLRALRCYASMLDEEYGAGLAPEARTLLTKVIGAVREMDRMTVDLLALARAGIPDGSMSWVDTSEVVRQVLADLAPQCTGRVSFRFGELCKCLGHAGLLRQVWANLISNALKFTRELDPALIELGSFPARGVSTWFVRDNGLGFDSRHARDLFVPFRRLHDARQVEGHGMGLAIVRRIVECHGGRLWAESRPGEGATFYFTLGGAVTPGE